MPTTVETMYVTSYSRTILPTTAVSHLRALLHPPTLNQQTVPASAGYSTTDIREIFNKGYLRDIQQRIFARYSTKDVHGTTNIQHSIVADNSTWDIRSTF